MVKVFYLFGGFSADSARFWKSTTAIPSMYYVLPPLPCAMFCISQPYVINLSDYFYSSYFYFITQR